MTGKADQADAPIYGRPPSTSIIVPTLNEEHWISQALESLRTQNIVQAFPDQFEIVVVDSASEDRTVEIARSLANRVLDAPRGKLNAKHQAVLSSTAEIIVFCDADTTYPPNWLNLLLRHFQNPDVVAVGGSSVSDNWVFNIGYVWSNLSGWMFGKRLWGRNMAVRRQAYLAVGGFNLSVDQQDVHAMIYAEEQEIVGRLKTFGTVTYDLEACVVTSNRMVYCAPRGVGLPCKGTECPSIEEYCQQIIRKLRF